MLKTPIMESYPWTKLSQSKQLNRSKATSNFFRGKSLNEKVKMISETVLVIKIPEVVKWNRNFKENKEQE